MSSALLDTHVETDLRVRILQKAGPLLMSRGFTLLNMSDLATDLGISKKTLYLHFETKQQLALAVIEAFAANLRRDAEAILSDPSLNFLDKLQGLMLGIIERMSVVNSGALEDLKRRAPEAYLRIEQLRAKMIPYLFGSLLEQGIEEGLVREDVNLALAIDYHLHAIQGLLDPAALARLKLSLGAASQQAFRIFFHGVLNPSATQQ